MKKIKKQKVAFVGSLILFVIVCLQATASAESPFAAGSKYAQARTVKIYGAGIGNVIGYGSGILVSPEGQILTTQGVYLSGQRIRVVTADGTEHQAKVLRRNRELQLALLKIEAKTPAYFKLSDKPCGEVGDWALAVSNAFKVADGPEPLGVNLGVIGLRARIDANRGGSELTYDGELVLLDAITSNPGAPGGAVVLPSGELIGMIGKVMESKATGVRLNYAVPVDLLHQFVFGKTTDLVDNGDEKVGDIGIRLFALTGRGGPAYIERCIPGGPAAKAGLRSDDLVVSLNGVTIRSVRDYDKVARELVAGKTVSVVVKRRKEIINVQITPLPKS